MIYFHERAHKHTRREREGGGGGELSWLLLASTYCPRLVPMYMRRKEGKKEGITRKEANNKLMLLFWDVFIGGTISKLIYIHARNAEAAAATADQSLYVRMYVRQTQVRLGIRSFSTRTNERTNERTKEIWKRVFAGHEFGNVSTATSEWASERSRSVGRLVDLAIREWKRNAASSFCNQILLAMYCTCVSIATNGTEEKKILTAAGHGNIF